MGPLAARLLVAIGVALAGPAAAAEAWRPIFNGKDLGGWVVKVNHRPLGENWRDTFRVKDGVLQVTYADYGTFRDEFAHLVYKTPLSHYRLRFEYRFLGPPTPGAPSWAVRNSGVMLHGQAPETMALDQSFPISVEAQLLAAAPGETRTTGNVCTPGTTVSIGGQPRREHCINSASPAHPEGEWVRFEVEVRGSQLIRQMVNGRPVLEYADIRLAPGEYAALGATSPDVAAQGATPLERGYVSLQGEGHPLEFRRIEVLDLAGDQ